MGIRITPKVKFIASACAVIILLTVVIIGLAVGLRSSPSKNGDSPLQFTLPTSAAAAQETKDGFPPSEMRKFRFASATSDATLCSQIGTDIMGRKGGTAVDAAIATVICVGAANPHSTGIGGGHFSLIYHSPKGGGEREVSAILSRETAPAASHKDMYVNDTKASTFGGKAIGVPGEVHGYYKAWSRYGRVAWEDLFYPTIRLLTEGIPVSRALAGAAALRAEIIKESQTLSAVYLREDGEVVKEGDIIKDPTLARTLQRIAADPFTFYNGSLAKDIVADIADAGGIITEEDLRTYESKFKSPTKVKLHNGGYTLYGVPPPSSGVVLQHIMKILDGYNMSESDVNLSAERRTLTAHRIIEAFKFAYAKRSALGDEDFWDTEELIKNMTSEEYANYIRSKIDDNQTFNVSYYEPAFEGFADSGTSQTSVIDHYGNAVGLTSTVNLYFGSKVKGRRTGIIFNNEMDDFSTPGTVNFFGIPASPSNFVEPGKMPMSSMAPSIFVTSRGTPALVIGGSGGGRITTQIAAVAVNNLWLGKDLKTAIDKPRLHHQLLPHEVFYETSNDPDLVHALAGKGHIMKEYQDPLAIIGGIRNQCDKCYPDCVEVYCIEAVADGRKGGIPNGF